MAHHLPSRSFRPTHIPSPATLTALRSALAGLNLSTPQAIGIQHRHASHQAQGRANGAKDGPGKRLGAKKTDGQYVVPGNILYKQRGTLWFPGDGCFMGRDHTIHAKVPGYVKYYRDPSYPKRKYIGVVFNRNNTLPQPPNAARRRMLGMLAYRIPESNSTPITADIDTSSETGRSSTFSPITPTSTPSIDELKAPSPIIHPSIPPPYPQTATIKNRRENGEVIKTTLTLRRGYQWRQANYEIGRDALESKAARNVEPYKRGDRWLAWRKRRARKERAIEQRALKGGGAKGKGRKKR